MSRIRSIFLPVGKEPEVKEFNNSHEAFEAETKFIKEYKGCEFTDHLSIGYSPSVIDEDSSNEDKCKLIIRFDDFGAINGNMPNRQITIDSFSQKLNSTIYGNMTVAKMKSGAEDCSDFTDKEIDFFTEMFSLKNAKVVPKKYHNLVSKLDDALLKLFLGIPISEADLN